MEIELKLLVAPADGKKLLKHPLIRRHSIGKPTQSALFAIYFDTPDLLMRRHDAGLRVRKADGQWVQTMKAGGSVQGGLHQRHEWETPVDASLPELQKLRAVIPPDSQWASLVGSPSLAERLHPLFTVQVRRTTWNLQIGEDAIELVLDQGTIEREEAVIPVSEIELELKSGNPQCLYAFALQLLEDIPMRLENKSKAERGYALYHADPRAESRTSACKAKELALPRAATIEQGLHAILENCLAHIQGNEAGVAEDKHSESLHQMRVGLRRLRSAFKLFEDAISLPPSLQEQLAWLGSELGPARDWDVLSTSTLKLMAAASGAEKQLVPLQSKVAKIVRDQRKKAADAVSSPRYTRLMLSLFWWMQAAEWHAEMPAAQIGRLDEPLDTFASRILERGHRRIVKRGRHIRDADQHELHRLRIACKRNRYAAEFFQSLYPPKRVRRYVAALAAMQDELGWRNDAAVAAGLLEQAQGQRPDAAMAAATGFAKGYFAARLQSDNRALSKTWKKFHAQKIPFRK